MLYMCYYTVNTDPHKEDDVMNIAKFAGLIAGVCAGLLLVLALARRTNTDGRARTEYDERQKIARGVGYKYGYYTLLIYMAVIVALDCLEVPLPFSNIIMSFTGIVISGLVLSWYCIKHDAYWGLNSNIVFYTRFLIGLGGLNLIYGIIEMIRGRMIVDGILQDTFINFEAGILIAGIGIMLLIKNRKDRKEEGGMQS